MSVGLALLLGMVPLQRALAPAHGPYHPWWELPGLVAGAALLVVGLVFVFMPTAPTVPSTEMGRHIEALRATAHRLREAVRACRNTSFGNSIEEKMFRHHARRIAGGVDRYQEAVDAFAEKSKEVDNYFTQAVQDFDEDDGWDRGDLLRAARQLVRSAASEHYRHGADPPSEFEGIHLEKDGRFLLQWLVRERPGKAFGFVIWNSPKDDRDEFRTTLEAWLLKTLSSPEYQRFKAALRALYTLQDTTSRDLEEALTRPGFPGKCGKVCQQRG
jgi:hypothetical protein